MLKRETLGILLILLIAVAILVGIWLGATIGYRMALPDQTDAAFSIYDPRAPKRALPDVPGTPGYRFRKAVCPQTPNNSSMVAFFEKCAAEVKAREVQLRSVTIVNSVESTPSACVEVWPARHDGSCNIADRP